MRKLLYAALGIAVAFLTLTLVRPALANETPALDFASCSNLKGFYVNQDEDSADDDDGNRLPKATVDGLEFSGKQLIHHATILDTDNLKPGSYVASVAPDQPSFFSVEVLNSDNTGYATLRWNLANAEWDMTVSGTTYHNANPSALVDLKGKSHRVISFGVGYTAKPAGTVTTVVSSITFHGTKYDLTCKPPVTKPTTPPTTKPTTKAPSHTVTAKPSVSKTSAAGAGAAAGGGSSGGALAITGPSIWTISAVAGALAVFGGMLVFLGRRRKQTFSA